MDYIINYTSTTSETAAEREKTLDAINYHAAVSVLDRLRRQKEITPTEYNEMRAFLARRFHQFDEDGGCV